MKKSYPEFTTIKQLIDCPNAAEYLRNLLEIKTLEEIKSMPGFDDDTLMYDIDRYGPIPYHFFDAVLRHWNDHRYSPKQPTNARELAQMFTRLMPTVDNNPLEASWLIWPDRVKHYVEEAIQLNADEIIRIIRQDWHGSIVIKTRTPSGIVAQYRRGRVLYYSTNAIELHIQADRYHPTDMDGTKLYNPFFFMVIDIKPVLQPGEEIPVLDGRCLAKELKNYSHWNQRMAWGLHLLGTRIVEYYKFKPTEVEIRCYPEPDFLGLIPLDDESTDTYIGVGVSYREPVDECFYVNLKTNEITKISDEKLKSYKKQIEIIRKRAEFVKDSDLNYNSLIDYKVLNVSIIPEIKDEIDAIADEIPLANGEKDFLADFVPLADHIEFDWLTVPKDNE